MTVASIWAQLVLMTGGGVPGVYLSSSANLRICANLALRKINNLRSLNTTLFRCPPPRPTNLFFLNDLATWRGGKRRRFGPLGMSHSEINDDSTEIIPPGSLAGPQFTESWRMKFQHDKTTMLSASMALNV
jgi:hypothetical protein